MVEHAVDTDELRALASSLAEFAEFLATFESRTVSHSNSLLNAWSGRASIEFISEVAVWAVGAKALQARADNMAKWAESATSVYVAAADSTKQVIGA